MKKGDIVFFHPLLIHGSGENKSTGYRKVNHKLHSHSAATSLMLTATTSTLRVHSRSQWRMKWWLIWQKSMPSLKTPTSLILMFGSASLDWLRERRTQTASDWLFYRYIISTLLLRFELIFPIKKELKKRFPQPIAKRWSSFSLPHMSKYSSKVSRFFEGHDQI